MAIVKLALDRLTPREVVLLGNQIIKAMTGNENFETPYPSLVDLGKLCATAATKVEAQENALLAATQATADRDEVIRELCGMITSLGSYVENITDGNAVKIQSAGMSVKSVPSAYGVLAQVGNLAVTAGDDDGVLDLTWNPVRGRTSYEVQVCPDPITPANWRSGTPCSRSRKTIRGLTSGQRMWVRVRAIAPKEENHGAWSNPAVKIVP